MARQLQQLIYSALVIGCLSLLSGVLPVHIVHAERHAEQFNAVRPEIGPTGIINPPTQPGRLDRDQQGGVTYDTSTDNNGSGGFNGNTNRPGMTSQLVLCCSII